ncbi:hypothetical protein N2152v2_003224 [Parachlorella kessleri]
MALVALHTARPAGCLARLTVKRAPRPVRPVRAADIAFEVSDFFSKEWEPRSQSLASYDDVQEYYQRTSAAGWTSTPSSLASEAATVADWYDASGIMSKEWALASYEEPVNNFRRSLDSEE